MGYFRELIEEAKKSKAFFGTVDKKSYAVQVDGVDNEFPTYAFGRQLEDLKKIKEFKNSAKSVRVDAKGKGTLPSVKAWVKEVNPAEFYAAWEKDSSTYKDDSVEIFYK